MFVPSYPVTRARFDRAIATRDLAGVRAAARELPGGLGLRDALDALPAHGSRAVLAALLTRVR